MTFAEALIITGAVVGIIVGVVLIWAIAKGHV